MTQLFAGRLQRYRFKEEEGCSILGNIAAWADNAGLPQYNEQNNYRRYTIGALVG
jgi:hypothetical protein